MMRNLLKKLSSIMKNSGNETKQVIVVRKDLKLSKGKLAAQAAHAAVSAAEKSRYKQNWMDEDQAKVILKCENEKELLEIFQQAKDTGLPAKLIRDAGRTELEPGEKTCVGIGPYPIDEIDKITGKLKLL